MIKKLVEKILFSTKWLLIPFYFGLISALGIYCFIILKEVYHLILEFRTISEEDGMLAILKLADMTMIANLVKMIITGSYTSFVNKYHSEESEKVSSGVLKIKMATSLIGVAFIHMLQDFINAKNVTIEIINKHLLITGVFIIGSMILAWIDYMHLKSEKFHEEKKH